VDTEIVVALVAGTATIVTAASSFGAAALTHRKADRKFDAKLEQRIQQRDGEIEELRTEMRSQRHDIERAFTRMRIAIRRLIQELGEHDPYNPMIEEGVAVMDEAAEILGD